MPAVIIDQARWNQLEQVQIEVDHKVRYVSDMERFGVEDWWEPASDKGDCEDIVLAKRQRLMAMGWPAEALRVAVVLDGHHELHAVLTVDVETPQGRAATYVLDSHFQHVEPWQYLSEYGYTWLERSKPGSTEWARLDNGAAAQAQRIALLATAIMPASPRWDDSQTTKAPLPAAGPVTVTASVKLLGDELRVAAREAVPTMLDAGDDSALLIQAGVAKEETLEASAKDDVDVAPASAHASRHGRHHGHSHAAHGGHGRHKGRHAA